MRRVGLLLAALALVVLACGVPEDDSPQELSADEVPFGLLTTPTTTTEPSQVPPPERRATLFVVNADGQLVDIIGEVADQSPHTVVTACSRSTPPASTRGCSSNIPPETTLLDSIVDDDVLTVDLSEQFRLVEVNRFVRAVAQVVFTATGIDGAAIDAISFRVEGELIDVPDADRGPAERPGVAERLPEPPGRQRLKRSTSARRWTLPVEVWGSSSSTTTSFGHL